jgi:hypothetical protein
MGSPTAHFQVRVEGSPARGAADALVTIVMFGGFQDPFSRRAMETIARLQARYGADLRLVWKDAPLPFHKNAKPAAGLAREAFAKGNASRFWKVHGLLFERSARLERAELLRVAALAGIPRQRALAAIEQPHPAIEEDLAQGSSLRVTGTPSFFINGRRLTGAMPEEKFSEVIDEELARASALVASGTARSDVYAAVQRDALVPIPQGVERGAPAPPVGAGGGGSGAAGGAARAERIAAQHLLISFKGASRVAPGVTRSRAEATARAEEALARARAGGDFDALVVQYSDEVGAPDRTPPGGLGEFRRGMMVPAFEQAAFALEVGEISPVVETPFGFHLIRRLR